MLAKLKQMIDGFTGEGTGDKQRSIDDRKLAAASLLVHATLVDGDLHPAEQHKLKELLQSNYQLTETETAELIELATREENRAVDLYGFTRRLTRELKPEERLNIIEMLWEIAYSDGVLHEFEDNLIWRVAELMHVAPRERIRLRQKVSARLKIT